MIKMENFDQRAYTYLSRISKRLSPGDMSKHLNNICYEIESHGNLNQKLKILTRELKQRN